MRRVGTSLIYRLKAEIYKLDLKNRLSNLLKKLLVAHKKGGAHCQCPLNGSAPAQGEIPYWFYDKHPWGFFVSFINYNYSKVIFCH